MMLLVCGKIDSCRRKRRFIFHFSVCPFSGICIYVCMVHSGFRTFICQVQFSGDSLSELRFQFCFRWTSTFYVQVSDSLAML